MIDYETLRRDLRDDSLAGYFGAGLGGCLMDAIDADYASDYELEEMAVRQGLSLMDYEIDD